jgi:hypothetical protein
MSKTNKISAVILEKDMITIVNHVEDIKNKLPFRIDLSPEEKQELPKMRDRNASWVLKTLEYAQANPSLVPGYVDLQEWAKDVKLVQDLLKLYRPLAQLVSQLDDSLTLAGSEAMMASLAYYNNLKGAAKAGVPGTKPMLEDLSSRFPGRPKSAKKETEEA